MDLNRTIRKGSSDTSVADQVFVITHIYSDGGAAFANAATECCERFPKCMTVAQNCHSPTDNGRCGTLSTQPGAKGRASSADVNSADTTLRCLPLRPGSDRQTARVACSDLAAGRSLGGIMQARISAFG